MKKHWFTLVELIVVITILSVLWTISFVSLQWYTENARDTKRISDVKSIEKWLSFNFTKNGKYLEPEESIEITNSGVTILKQWLAWDTILWNIWVEIWTKDPVDNNYYTYTVSEDLKKMQLLWYLETSEEDRQTIKTIYAEEGYGNRYLLLRWDKLWIFIEDSTYKPINKQTTWTNLELQSPEIENYKSILSQEEIYTWSWTTWVLKNRDCRRLQEYYWYTENWTYKINPDWTNEFDVYCDMITDWGGWTLVLKADGSKNTFNFNSEYWTNNSVYWNQNYLEDNLEFKNLGFSTINFDNIKLELKTGDYIDSINFNYNSSSLLDLFLNNNNLQFDWYNKNDFMNLVPNSSLQPNCNAVWLNLKFSNGNQHGIRLWISSNNENNCSSDDSRIWIWLSPRNWLNSSVWNICWSTQCRDINGNYTSNKNINSFWYLYIR